MIVRRALAAGLLSMLTIAGCGDDGDGATENDPETTSVLTAAELEDTVDELVAAFNATNPDVEIIVTTEDLQGMNSAAGSDSPPDVVLGPDSWLTSVTDDLESVGRNLAVIVVPDGNPAGVTSIDQLSDLDVMACGPSSQFGNLMQVVLDQNGVTVPDGSIDEDCEAEALEALAAGEIEAALMLRDHADVTGGLEVVEIPDDQNLLVPLSSFVGSDEADGAAFAEFLTSAEAQTVLTEAGYLP